MITENDMTEWYNKTYMSDYSEDVLRWWGEYTHKQRYDSNSKPRKFINCSLILLPSYEFEYYEGGVRNIRGKWKERDQQSLTLTSDETYQIKKVNLMPVTIDFKLREKSIFSMTKKFSILPKGTPFVGEWSSFNPCFLTILARHEKDSIFSQLPLILHFQIYNIMLKSNIFLGYTFIFASPNQVKIKPVKKNYQTVKIDAYDQIYCARSEELLQGVFYCTGDLVSFNFAEDLLPKLEQMDLANNEPVFTNGTYSTQLQRKKLGGKLSWHVENEEYLILRLSHGKDLIILTKG